MQTIATFVNGVTANMAKARLADAGIPVFLTNELTSSVAWHLINAFGGIELQVSDEHADEARAILADHEPVPATRLHSIDEEDYSPQQLAEDETENTLNPREQLAERALRTAFLSLLLAPLVFYAIWLLSDIALSAEPLRPAYRRKAIFASILALPYFVIACFWFRFEIWRLFA